ncbi:hypothetical protein RJT34_08306 [Clitoria ternatea]|uniref:AP2/ERF domain-containing protein n=1 Tax=Clitoria ternatea TaxID=43366 RepID=A0AAN9PVL2_CLITE
MAGDDSARKIYKGVRKRKWGKWVSEIRLPNSRERIWLGSYDTQEKAARAFDAALYCLRGKNASFNFPNTPLNLEEINVLAHQSLSHQEIQQVAAKFANNPPIGTPASQDPSSQTGVHSLGLFDDDATNDKSKPNSFLDESANNDLMSMDWTFLNMLDDLNHHDFEHYFGPDKLHPGDSFSSTTQQPQVDNAGEIDFEGDLDAFSNHSFLWSWNF